MLKQYYVCILNQRYAMPITQKSQLFGLVLISFIVLGISTLFSLSKEENTETSKACIHELEGKVSVLPSDKNQLVVVDKKGNHYFPVIVGEKTNLTATASAKICYNKIDASNPNHKMIYVEKVVFLPSLNEKR